jgi:hypothetical protein
VPSQTCVMGSQFSDPNYYLVSFLILARRLESDRLFDFFVPVCAALFNDKARNVSTSFYIDSSCKEKRRAALILRPAELDEGVQVDRPDPSTAVHGRPNLSVHK